MLRNRNIGLLASLAIAVVVSTFVKADTDVGPDNPVENLRKILRTPVEDARDLRDREEQLAKVIATLRTVQDLERALALGAWLDQDPDLQLAAVDAKAREEIVKRFITDLRTAMDRPETQLAAVNIIADLGPDLRETGETVVVKRGVMRRLAPEVARLAEAGAGEVRIGAARALGNIDPPAEFAAPALGSLLAASDLAVRRGGAAGIKNAIQQAQKLLPTSGRGAAGGVATTWLDTLRLCAALVPKAASGVTDSDVTVRRDCSEALRISAHLLYDYLFKPLAAAKIPMMDTQGGAQPRAVEPGRPVDPGRRDDETEQAAMVSLARAFVQQAPAINRMLADSDASVRLLGRRVLEDLADARRRLMAPGLAPELPPRRDTLPPPGTPDVKRTSYNANDGIEPQQSPSPQANEAVRKGLSEVLENLAAGINDPDVEVRRATVGVLELMGSDAAPANPALIQAVGDSDRFVRWIAGRALGRTRPADEAAIAALAGLLQDPDLDVRQVGALALERYGSRARSAVPSLGRAVESGDPEARIAALRALQSMGSDALPAVPSVVVALSANNSRVRQGAARTLGRFGPGARSAEPALRAALLDNDADVRAAAGEALLSVLQPDAGR